MNNYEALKTATLNAASIHDFLGDMGSIQVGKRANFNLSKQNPLVNLQTLRKPNVVFVNGLMLKRATLDEYEIKAKNRSNLIVSGLRYAENLLVEK